MDDTAIVGENVEVIQATGDSRAEISWSGAIAGALGATAINFILIALGSGIGLAITRDEYDEVPAGMAPA